VGNFPPPAPLLVASLPLPRAPFTPPPSFGYGDVRVSLLHSSIFSFLDLTVAFFSYNLLAVPPQHRVFSFFLPRVFLPVFPFVPEESFVHLVGADPCLLFPLRSSFSKKSFSFPSPSARFLSHFFPHTALPPFPFFSIFNPGFPPESSQFISGPHSFPGFSSLLPACLVTPLSYVFLFWDCQISLQSFCGFGKAFSINFSILKTCFPFLSPAHSPTQGSFCRTLDLFLLRGISLGFFPFLNIVPPFSPRSVFRYEGSSSSTVSNGLLVSLLQVTVFSVPLFFFPCPAETALRSECLPPPEPPFPFFLSIPLISKTLLTTRKTSHPYLTRRPKSSPASIFFFHNPPLSLF